MEIVPIKCPFYSMSRKSSFILFEQLTAFGGWKPTKRFYVKTLTLNKWLAAGPIFMETNKSMEIGDKSFTKIEGLHILSDA